jgi:hypothetical protein
MQIRLNHDQAATLILMTREKSILCFGDSNTWGYIPLTGERLPRTQRWTGVIQHLLGHSCHVIEEGLNGRSTAFDEPFRDGRNARRGLLAVLETHRPVDLLIIMLGTNDLKHHLNVSAYESARGLAALLQIVLKSETGSDQEPPKTLVVAPPRFGAMSDLMAQHFEGAADRSGQLPVHYAAVCREVGCSFLDSNQVVSVGGDGIHLCEEGHHALAVALAPVVKDLIGEHH